jgi:hypothetical protein
MQADCASFGLNTQRDDELYPLAPRRGQATGEELSPPTTWLIELNSEYMDPSSSFTRG